MYVSDSSDSFCQLLVRLSLMCKVYALSHLFSRICFACWIFGYANLFCLLLSWVKFVCMFLIRLISYELVLGSLLVSLYVESMIIFLSFLRVFQCWHLMMMPMLCSLDGGILLV